MYLKHFKSSHSHNDVSGSLLSAQYSKSRKDLSGLSCSPWHWVHTFKAPLSWWRQITLRSSPLCTFTACFFLKWVTQTQPFGVLSIHITTLQIVRLGYVYPKNIFLLQEHTTATRNFWSCHRYGKSHIFTKAGNVTTNKGVNLRGKVLDFSSQGGTAPAGAMPHTTAVRDPIHWLDAAYKLANKLQFAITGTSRKSFWNRGGEEREREALRRHSGNVSATSPHPALPGIHAGMAPGTRFRASPELRS